MAIPQICKNRLIYHFTDIKNLESIIEHGLLSTNEKKKQGISHVNIANEDIQARRSTMKVTCGPQGVVHDYVPFYFCSRTPMMLGVINAKNVDQQCLIYLCMPIDVVEQKNIVFTDASANTDNPPNFYDDPSDLEKLNWSLIKSKKWSCDNDEDRHHKMAEVLIHGIVDISKIPYIIVYNEEVKDEVQKIFKKKNISVPNVLYDNDSKLCGDRVYFTKFFIKDRKREILVTGPNCLQYKFQEAFNRVGKYKRENKEPKKYKDIAEIVKAIDDDFNCINELREIDDLEMSYGEHHETVGEHTRNVVENLEKQPEYSKCSSEIQNILKLAAYLHDIGKGPKNKWKDGKMARPYPDHPVDAIPMVVRIMTEIVTELTDDEIRKVLLLVAYHDIVGECLNKGRDKSQIADVVNDISEAKLLIIIAKADCLAIKKEWYDTICNKEKSLLKEIEGLLKNK